MEDDDDQEKRGGGGRDRVGGGTEGAAGRVRSRERESGGAVSGDSVPVVDVARRMDGEDFAAFEARVFAGLFP